MTLTATPAGVAVPKVTTETGRIQPMPDLTPDQHDALRADIAARGITVPIVVDQHGRVLDGHNRLAIAAELGIDCPQVTQVVTDDDDAGDRAVALNCARRHLTREQKQQIIAAEIERRPGDSDRAIARRVGCSPSTVGAVRRGEVSKLDTYTTLADFCTEIVSDPSRWLLDGGYQFSTGPGGEPHKRDWAYFLGYLALLHGPDLCAPADDGALTLLCGGVEHGCMVCAVAIGYDTLTFEGARAEIARLESGGAPLERPAVDA